MSVWCFLFVVVILPKLVVFVSSFSFVFFCFYVFGFVLSTPLLCGES